jgi:hypothetical protein
MFKRSVIQVLMVFLIAISTALAGNQDDGITAIKTAKGIVLVCNQPGTYFTLDINGTSIKPLDNTEHLFFDVDGTILQMHTASITEFKVGGADKTTDAMSILIAHRDWEVEYFEGAFGKKLKVHSSSLKLENGIEALKWEYEMPEGVNADAKTQMFLTIVLGKYVVVLNGVVRIGNKEDEVERLLKASIESLQVMSKPISVKEMQERIRKSSN